MTLGVVDSNRLQPNVHLTVRSSDNLSVLTDLYEATVLPGGAYGKFLCKCNGRRLNFWSTPAILEMKDGDMLEFFPMY